MSRDHALLQAFASELKARRSALKLSQEEFAFRADVNRTYIAKLELAQNQPTLCVMHQLAVALNNELPDLIQAVLLRYNRNISIFSDLQKGWSAPSDCKPETDEQRVSQSISNDLTHESPINLELKQTDSQAVSVRNRKVVVEIDHMMSSRRPIIYRMIEIAAVEILDGKVSGSTFHVYLDPGDEVDSPYPSKYKWPHELLAGKPKFADVANSLVTFINGSEVLTHGKYPYLRILSDELICVGLAPLNEICSNIVSTYSLAYKLLKVKLQTLEKLCHRFEVDPNQYRLMQGCMSDARLLAEIYVRMCPVVPRPVTETSG